MEWGAHTLPRAKGKMAKPTGSYKRDFDEAAAEVKDCLMAAFKIGGPDWAVKTFVEAYNTMYGGSMDKTCMSLMVLVGEMWNEI